MAKNIKNLWKLMAIANIDRESLHIFWTTLEISMKFSGKMRFMILKVTKKEFHPLFRRYIFGKTSTWSPAFLGLKCQVLPKDLLKWKLIWIFIFKLMFHKGFYGIYVIFQRYHKQVKKKYSFSRIDTKKTKNFHKLEASVLSGKISFFVIGPFVLPIQFALTLAFDRAVLSGNVALLFVALWTKK